MAAFWLMSDAKPFEPVTLLRRSLSVFSAVTPPLVKILNSIQLLTWAFLGFGCG